LGLRGSGRGRRAGRRRSQGQQQHDLCYCERSGQPSWGSTRGRCDRNPRLIQGTSHGRFSSGKAHGHHSVTNHGGRSGGNSHRLGGGDLRGSGGARQLNIRVRRASCARRRDEPWRRARYRGANTFMEHSSPGRQLVVGHLLKRECYAMVVKRGFVPFHGVPAKLPDGPWGAGFKTASGRPGGGGRTTGRA